VNIKIAAERALRHARSQRHIKQFPNVDWSVRHVFSRHVSEVVTTCAISQDILRATLDQHT